MITPAPLYSLCRICHYYGSKKVLAFAMAPSQGEFRFNDRREYPMSVRVRSKVALTFGPG